MRGLQSPDDTLETAQTRKVDLIAKKLALNGRDRDSWTSAAAGARWPSTPRERSARAWSASRSRSHRRSTRASAPDARGWPTSSSSGCTTTATSTTAPTTRSPRSACPSTSGAAPWRRYIERIFDLLRPGGRLLNHAIGRPVASTRTPPSRAAETWRQVQVALGLRGPSRIHSPFIERYVFPDGELHEVGTMVSFFQGHGFEVRHLESLREHYALTLRHWIANLESALRRRRRRGRRAQGAGLAPLHGGVGRRLRAPPPRDPSDPRRARRPRPQRDGASTALRTSRLGNATTPRGSLVLGIFRRHS